MKATMSDNLDSIDQIVTTAARSGLAINAGYYRDQERCRQQSHEAAAGIYTIEVGRNRYGFAVRPTTNLINNGMWISPNFPTAEGAVAWAKRHVAEAPSRRSILIRDVVLETAKIRPFMGKAGGFVVEYVRTDGTGSRSRRFATEAEAMAFEEGRTR